MMKFRYTHLTLFMALFFICSCQAQKEQYGNLQFSPWTVQQKFHIGDDPAAPASNYELKLFYASKGEEQTKNWLNKQLIHILFGEEYAVQNLSFQEAEKQFTQNYKKDYFEDVSEPYQRDVEEDPNEIAAWYNYEYLLEAEVKDYAQDLLSIRTYTAMYTGGAHGMYYTNYFNFDLRQQKIIKLEDIFKEGYADSLSELLVAQLKEDYQTEDLSEHMITESDIYPTSNFLLGTQGITFCYAPYGIAAYAAGEIEITLSYKQLSPILKTDN